MKDKIVIDTNNIKKETFSSKYLYGVPGNYFKDMSYIEAIKEKIRLGKELIKNLSEVICDTDFINSSCSSDYSVINERLTDVQKAVEYNKLLLKDMSI